MGVWFEEREVMAKEKFCEVAVYSFRYKKNYPNP
jgi:hypothetical protein